MSSPTSGQMESGELQCIWMMAGVLNYQLCNQHYDCEHCELHKVLSGKGLLSSDELESDPAGYQGPDCQRQHPDLVEHQVEQWMNQIFSRSKIYLDRCYSGSHFWMYPEKEKVVVGMDTNILKILYPIKQLIPPNLDREIQRNQYCGLIVRDNIEFTIPLHAPCAGKVVEINDDYVEQVPRTYPNQDDWLFKMLPTENVESIDDICRGQEMLRWYVRRIDLVKEYLRDMLSRTAVEEIGLTMADGGEAVLDLAQILGHEKYKNLVREIFLLP